MAAIFGSEKAQRFLELRKIDFVRPEGKIIWIHGASSGEGNQVLAMAPLLSRRFNARVVLSVFSPSGYSFHQDNQEFISVVNLPLDQGNNAGKFIDELQPEFAIFVRNELWKNYLLTLSRQNIPCFLINTPAHILRPKSPFIGQYVKNCLKHFALIFPISGKIDLIDGSNISAVHGDTKLEGALSKMKQEPDPTLALFTKDNMCIVGGSTWEKEESFLGKWLQQNHKKKVKLIIAPHVITSNRLISVKITFDDHCLYSKYNEVTDRDKKVMILDDYGLLQKAYSYADLAVVGGAFSKGLHNVTEPAIHGLPILFGPDHQKFPEAGQLLELGCAFSVKNFDQFESQLNRLIGDDAARSKIRLSLQAYADVHTGISEKIVSEISRYLNQHTSDQ